MLGGDYDDLAPLFAGALFDLRVDHGSVWLTAAADSVALWEPPGGTTHDVVGPAQVWAAFRSVAPPDVLRRVAAYEEAVDLVTSEAPYWYLGVLATRPGAQGRGGATAVLEPVLTSADRDGIDCCLETSTQANREFYARRGFTEATAVVIPDGPPTWWLRRPARAAH